MLRTSGWLWVASLVTTCLLGFSQTGVLRAQDTADEEEGFPGKKSEWNGYDRYDFIASGRECLVVVPKKAAPQNPWIWRTEFFGHEPQADLALLEKGFHVVYMNVQNMYGAPVAMVHMDAFYDLLTRKHHLSKKVVLEGFSRGGLFAFNWAALHPRRVSCIYADAPVCDIKSWPGGKGKGKGSPADWQNCLKIYGFTEAEATAYKRNPIDTLTILAKANVALIHVVGDADDVVPLEENTGIVEKRYKELGGTIKVIVKNGVGHHPHSLQDPQPIVDFILEHSGQMTPPT
jgi:pimeloyl-ACP methyl ester carboxylesterase